MLWGTCPDGVARVLSEARVALDIQGDRVSGVRSQAVPFGFHAPGCQAGAGLDPPAGTLLDCRAVESSGRDDMSLFPGVLR